MTEEMEQRIAVKLDLIETRLNEMAVKVTEVNIQFLARGGVMDRLEKVEALVGDVVAFKIRVLAIAATISAVVGTVTTLIVRYLTTK